jgi:hypothetical protein
MGVELGKRLAMELDRNLVAAAATLPAAAYISAKLRR